MTLLLVYLFIALFFSFVCSILEAIILSVTPSYIGVNKEQGKNFSFKLEELKNNIDKTLAGILTLNTFAHTIGASGVGSRAQVLWGNEYLTLVSIVLTILILIFSEIIPKTIGATYWEKLAPYTPVILKGIIYGLYPFVKISEYITNVLAKNREGYFFRRADFSALAKFGYKEGTLTESEFNIIKNLLKLRNIPVKEILTPRTVMFTEDENSTMNEFFEKHNEINFSRIVLYSQEKEKITGYALKSEIFDNILQNKGDNPLKTIKREVDFVYELLPIYKLFNLLVTKNEHIVIVIDEYGGIEGIVTMEDVFETLLGSEIVDESDSIANLQKLAKEKWEQKFNK
jgi:CBS domain containing-hemolysin-like protein